MKILVVNDDSIHAPGIALLAEAAMELGDVTVVAPAEQCSAMSQKITIRGDLKLRRAESFPVPVKAAWQLEGTPADCVKTAMHHILDEKPDLVLSGINAGWNVCFDIAHSGTLGAAFEALMYGVPAIAFSNAHGAALELPGRYLTPILRELAFRSPPEGSVWNVNFPAGKPDEMQGILWDRPVAPVPLFRESYIPSSCADGNISLAIGGTPLTAAEDVPAGTDLEAVLNGYISVGPVRCVVL